MISADKLLVIITLTFAALIARSQSVSSRPSFEVASVKPHPGGCGFMGEQSPGRILRCSSLADNIQMAYVLHTGAPNKHPRPMRLVGADGWISSVRYVITAKANPSASFDQMNGPMLQVLLEDRFKLKIHRETRIVPVYILSVAKGGLRMQPIKEGSCTPTDRNRPPAPAQPPTSYCGTTMVRGNGRNFTIDGRGMSMAELAADLSGMGSDRPVIDRTAPNTLFNIRLEFLSDVPLPGPEDPGPVLTGGLSMADALREHLGLKLTPDKGPEEVIVIDHAERPTEN